MSLREQIADSPANIEWHSDDGSTVVFIATDVVDGIAGYVSEAYKSIPRRGAEAGGLLLGGVRIGRVTEIFITGFEPVPIDYLYGPSFILSEAGQADFRAAMARHLPSEVLGYYRSHTRPGFGLESSDRETAARMFAGLSGLVLLIKPASAARLTASYYFFQRGNLEMRPVGREFPFVGNIPGGAPPPAAAEPEPEPTPILRRPEPEPTPVSRRPEPEPTPVSRRPEPEPTPISRRPEPPRPIQAPLELNDPRPAVTAPAETPENPPPAKERKSLQWEIVAAALMIAVAIGLLWWQYRGDSSDRDTVAHASASRVASLGLAVQPGAGGWRITWDPNSPAALDSIRGSLNVIEVDSHERIPLDVNQIRAGAATYRPSSDDITFRLDLVRSDNTLSTETYRVLLRPPEEEAKAPPALQAPKQAPMPPAEKAEAPAEKPGEKGEYSEPEVLTRVAPEVPEGIRPRITAPQPIDVRVTINAEGRVTSAKPIQRGEGLTNYLADRAVIAARQWTFTPAKQDGKPVSSSRTIHFVFEQ